MSLIWIVNILSVFFLCVFFAGIVIPQILLIAFRRRLFDEPDERKIHQCVVPRLGGMAFKPVVFFSFVLLLAVNVSTGHDELLKEIGAEALPLAYAFCAIIMLYLVGIADDLIGVRYRAKFFIQIVCGIMLVAGGVELSDLHGMLFIHSMPSWISIPLTVFVTVFIINAINLIDGIDGLASGLCSIAFLFYGMTFIWFHQYLYAMLAFATLGVLIPFYYYKEIYIETERIIIRNFKQKDAEGLLEYLSHPRVNCFAGDRLCSREAAWAYMQYSPKDMLRYAVSLKKDDFIIGDVFALRENEDTYMEKYNNWKLKFYTIWAGQAVSLITSAILQMAIIFYLTEKTGSAMVLSMASLVGFLPYAVFGPAIGVLVDRHDRKKIMIGADLIIAAAGAVLAIVALYMELPIWMVMVVLFIRSIGTAFHTPALNAVTPLLVPEEQLTKCAGYSQSLQSISYIVSPAVAALLYSVWGLNAIIAIDVLGAVIASITVAIVRIPKLGDQVQSLKPNFIQEMKEGMAVLRQNKGLFALLLVGTLYMFVYMPINALYPLITMEYFNGTPMHISITEIAYASGMLIGGLLLGLFGNYQKRILLITASIFMMGISLTISGLLPQSGFFIFVVCCAIMGLSVPFYSGVQTALFQEKIKPEYLGRVFSLTGSIMSLAMPIGLILSGFFADRIGVNHWFLLSGVLIIGIAIACPMITEVRKLDLKQNS